VKGFSHWRSTMRPASVAGGASAQHAQFSDELLRKPETQALISRARLVGKPEVRAEQRVVQEG